MKLNHFTAAVITYMFVGSISCATAHELRTSVQTALTSNPRIKAHDAAVRTAAFELLEMRGTYLPTVSLFGNVGPEYVDDPNGLSVLDNARTKTAREIGVVANLPVFDGYKRANTIFTRAAQLDRSMFEYLDASETMALLVVQAHMDVVRNQTILAVANDHLARHLDIARQVGEQVSGGKLPLSDQLQVESRVETVRITISQISNELEKSRSRYRELVGTPDVPSLTAPGLPSLPSNLDALVASSIQNNFRVKQAQANVDVRRFEKLTNEAEYLPQVSLSAGASVGADLDGASGNENRSFVSVNLNWKLFNGGRSERRAALLERQNEALYLRMATLREVQQIAETSWSGYQSSQRIANIAAKQVEINNDLVEQYTLEFQLATRSLLDLLIGETELFRSRIEMIDAKAGATFNAYRMLAAQSRLAQYFDIDSTGEALLLAVQANELQKPLDVVDRAVPIVKR
ncbi:TolC family protein [Ruegeria marina]|uniref:Type I secretion outer membrane protein, TolC family n=1 Tax=Ruegeria marina TaxID=639004 RepID=A0A1G7F9B5_9RHOB|nr:TolC family protein [Ruegeria marina]SDE72472.1 type I secretion outer membrane protein, TolC family [Ruegeria marina]